jgi:damage-control phosphatase, subfamily I
MTGVDPYRELKAKSNELALHILPELQSSMRETRNPVQQFRRAALIAAAANAIEFDVAGRDFSLEDFQDILNSVESDLVVDDIEPFRRLCKKVHNVTYLVDNAGEVALDMVLISQIKRLGPHVTAVVKSAPILNDATLEDAREVGLTAVADRVMDMGPPTIGVILNRASEEFKRVLFSSELIVAKGMGHYESITELELPCPVVHILRTKCNPVAESIGVPRNKNVILIRRP